MLKTAKKTSSKRVAPKAASKLKGTSLLRFARVRSRHPTHSILRRNPALRFNQSVVIRLGSTTAFTGAAVELNTIQAVRNCSDKIKMKSLFKSADLKSPKFFNEEQMRAEKKPHFPIIKKIRFRSRGNGMVFIENQEELNQELQANKGNTNVYYEEYFDGCREYRFHISPLGCFYTCRKVRKAGSEDRWYFNSLNSSWLLETNPKYNKPVTFNEIIKECQKGLKALGLDFGAFDVRVKKDGSFTVLEANSAPSFGDLTAQKYIEHIPKLVKFKQS